MLFCLRIYGFYISRFTFKEFGRDNKVEVEVGDEVLSVSLSTLSTLSYSLSYRFIYSVFGVRTGRAGRNIYSNSLT